MPTNQEMKMLGHLGLVTKLEGNMGALTSADFSKVLEQMLEDSTGFQSRPRGTFNGISSTQRRDCPLLRPP